MKYTLIFETEAEPDDEWGTTSDQLDIWHKETVVPRVGDSVYMKSGGWRIVKAIGFSTTGGYKGKKKNRRNVLISVSR